MTNSTLSKSVQRSIRKLQDRQGHMLVPGEEFIATFEGHPLDHAQPSHLWGSLGGVFGLLIGRHASKPAALRRKTEVSAHVAQSQAALVALPKSKNGYWIGVTDQRILVYNGSGKQYLTECSLWDTTFETVQHRDAMSTVIFGQATSRVAVTSDRHKADRASYFIQALHAAKGMSPSLARV